MWEKLFKCRNITLVSNYWILWKRRAKVKVWSSLSLTKTGLYPRIFRWRILTARGPQGSDVPQQKPRWCECGAQITAILGHKDEGFSALKKVKIWIQVQAWQDERGLVIRTSLGDKNLTTDRADCGFLFTEATLCLDRFVQNHISFLI